MYLIEKKDHIINKISGLSPDEKVQVINYFTTHPTEENKINWNNWKNLTFADFQPIITNLTKTGKKRAVQKKGIGGLKYNEDYVICYKKDGIIGYVPLNYGASKFIASKYIGGREGKWCIAYAKSSSHWDSYTTDDNIFIFFINERSSYKFKKVAVCINRWTNNRGSNYYYDIYDQNDNEVYGEEDMKSSKELPRWLFNREYMKVIIKKARKAVIGSKLGRPDANYRIISTVVIPNVSIQMKNRGLHASMSFDVVTEYNWDAIPEKRDHYGDYKAFLTLIEKNMLITSDIHFLYFIRDKLPEGTGVYIDSNFVDLEDYTGFEGNIQRGINPTNTSGLLDVLVASKLKFDAPINYILSTTAIEYSILYDFNCYEKPKKINDFFLYKEIGKIPEATYNDYLIRVITENNTIE
jgi:hypothetical protein